jgi:hypothetical protein
LTDHLFVDGVQGKQALFHHQLVGFSRTTFLRTFSALLGTSHAGGILVVLAFGGTTLACGGACLRNDSAGGASTGFDFGTSFANVGTIQTSLDAVLELRLPLIQALSHAFKASHLAVVAVQTASIALFGFRAKCHHGRQRHA